MKKKRNGFTLHLLQGKRKAKVKYRRKGAGFTLIELLIVIAVIGILSTMIIISVRNSKAKARDAERMININNIISALSLYNTLFNMYPIYSSTRITGTDGVSIDLINALTISSVPADPLSQNSSNCVGHPENGYYYFYDSDGSTFILEYCLETRIISGRDPGHNYIVP